MDAQTYEIQLKNGFYTLIQRSIAFMLPPLLRSIFTYVLLNFQNWLTQQGSFILGDSQTLPLDLSVNFDGLSARTTAKLASPPSAPGIKSPASPENSWILYSFNTTFRLSISPVILSWFDPTSNLYTTIDRGQVFLASMRRKRIDIGCLRLIYSIIIYLVNSGWYCKLHVVE